MLICNACGENYNIKQTKSISDANNSGTMPILFVINHLKYLSWKLDINKTLLKLIGPTFSVLGCMGVYEVAPPARVHCQKFDCDTCLLQNICFRQYPLRLWMRWRWEETWPRILKNLEGNVFRETYPDLWHLDSFSETLATATRNDRVPGMATGMQGTDKPVGLPNVCFVYCFHLAEFCTTLKMGHVSQVLVFVRSWSEFWELFLHACNKCKHLQFYES